MARRGSDHRNATLASTGDPVGKAKHSRTRIFIIYPTTWTRDTVISFLWRPPHTPAGRPNDVRSVEHPLHKHLLCKRVVRVRVGGITFVNGNNINLLCNDVVTGTLNGSTIRCVVSSTHFRHRTNSTLAIGNRPYGLASIHTDRTTPTSLIVLAIGAANLSRTLGAVRHVIKPGALVTSLYGNVADRRGVTRHFN